MKNIVFALAVTILAIGFSSCGNGDKHSKGYNASVKVLDDVMLKVELAKDCEALEAAMTGLSELYFMDDSIPLQSERDELSEKLLTLFETVNQKTVAMNCQEEEEYFDEEMPMEEPLEYEE